MELAARAARGLGLDPAGARALRVASAVTVDLPRAGIVARVEGPAGLATARRQVVAARICERRGVPAMRLAEGDRQPVDFGAGVVTLWRKLRIVEGAPSPEAMGRLTRRLHAATREALPAETPALDPFQPLSGWLDRPSRLPPPPGLGRLRRSLQRLRARWPRALAGDPLGTVLAHGDLHADNVALTADGPVLLDLETAGCGPASWDLVVQETAVRRYGVPADCFRRFCDAYGAGLPDWPTLDLLRRAYELHLTCWAVGHRDLSPALAEQARLRTATLLGEDDRPWTLI